MGNTHGMTKATKAALKRFDLETKRHPDYLISRSDFIEKRAAQKLLTVLNQRLRETKLRIPELPNIKGQFKAVYYVCLRKMKSGFFFPEPLAFSKVSFTPLGSTSLPTTEGLYSTQDFYKNAALTFSKPLGSFTLYTYRMIKIGEEVTSKLFPRDRMIKIGEKVSWNDLIKPPGIFHDDHDDVVLLIVEEGSPFSSDLIEAKAKAALKKACVLEHDDKEHALRIEQVAADQKELGVQARIKAAAKREKEAADALQLQKEWEAAQREKEINTVFVLPPPLPLPLSTRSPPPPDRDDSPGIGRLLIPSYHTILGEVTSLDEQYMEQVETWPSIRVNLLQIIREELEPRLKDTQYVIGALEDVFYDLKPLSEVGGKDSVFGLLYRGCLRSKTLPPSCFNADILKTGVPPHSVYLIIKLLPIFNGGVLRFSSIRRDQDGSVRWNGNKNPMREILMGRMLNRLVQRDITPHFPMIYERFTLGVHEPGDPSLDTRKEGFTMEMCHFDFEDYVLKHLIHVEDDAVRSQLLRIAIIQIVHGLAAAAQHFDFRHNDFHGRNAMMTFITNSVYTYKIGGDYYSVPNAGMCWKMIDFGYSSSRVFGEHDNAGTITHAPPYKDLAFDPNGHAIEMFDIARLLDYMYASTWNAHKYASSDYFTTATGIAVCTAAHVKALNSMVLELAWYMEVVKGIASTGRKHTTAVEAVSTAGSQSFDFTDPDFVGKVAHSNLMRALFCAVASQYKTDSRRGDSPVFDIDTTPFSANEHRAGPLSLLSML